MQRLKNARDAALRKLANWRQERDRKRRRRREKRRLRKATVELRRKTRKRAKELEARYDGLTQREDESDADFEARAFGVKAKAVAAREKQFALDRKAGRLHKLIQQLERDGDAAARHARWYAQVRLPRIRKKIRALRNRLDPKGSKIVSFDGKPVAEWLAYRLEAARAAGWNGGLNSGYRSPEYSEQLCYQICGAPSCPGRCAGRSSNHTKNVYPYGAVDVSDYANFGAIMRRLANQIPGVVIYNALGAADPWHHSSSGR